ncbi:DUF6291 domain-containing protein [Sulfurovum sp. CS9]|uniref:DUF6291 domain-containing protein n=1 Tax=Sulfurovum sp. CS9 TaxID=3391146 RepID=UPI0039E95233
MSKEHFTDQELKLLEKKNKFLIQDDMFEEIKLLKDSDIALLMYSIYEYATQRVLPELDEEYQIPVKMAFNRFRKQHDENLRDWLHGRIQKIKTGRKGGLSRRK